MSLRRIALILISFCLLASVLTACSEERALPKIWTTAEQKWLDENAGKTFVIACGEQDIENYYIDALVERFEKDLGICFKVVRQPMSCSLKPFYDGEIDLLFGLERMPVRESTMSFTEPLYEYAYMCFADKDSPIKALEDLEGKNIGFLQGDAAIEIFSEDYPLVEEKSIYFEAYQEMVDAVENQMVDCVVYANEGATFLNQDIRGAFKLQNIAKQKRIAVLKTNARLASVIGKEVKQLIQSQTAEAFYSEALLSYQKNHIGFSYAEFLYMRAKKDIIVSVKPDFRPFGYVNAAGEYVGINSEMLNKIAQLTDLHFRYTFNNNETAHYELMTREANPVDLVADVVHQIGEDGAERNIRYTEPIVTTEFLAVGSYSNDMVDSLYNLSPYRISVHNNCYFSGLIEAQIPNTHIVKFDSLQASLNAVIEGKADYTILPKLTFNSLPAEMSSLRNMGVLGDVEVCYAVSEKDPLLHSIIDKCLYVIDREEMIRNGVLEMPVSKTENILYFLIAILSLGLILILVLTMLQKKKRDRLEAQRIQQMVYYDHLTELFNRKGLKRELGQIPQSSDSQAAVYMIDMDNFKHINDSYGHDVGDEVLVWFAETLIRIVPKHSLCARIGGDEFNIIIMSCSEAEADQYADVMMKQLSVDTEIRGLRISVAFSMGVVVMPKHTTDFDEALKYADLAMYQSKYHKKGNCIWYNPTFYQQYVEKMEQYKALKAAIEAGNQFDIDIQPIYSLDSRTMCMAEVLVRWSHPQKGRLAAASFLDAAAGMGMMKELDIIVLKEACSCLKHWQEAYSFYMPIAVNLSYDSLIDPHIVQIISRVLKDAHLEPQYLIIEITEEKAIENIENAKEMLQNLRLMGVSVALDDFGKGYTNLSYLSELPIDILKVDKSLIDHIDNEKHRKIIEFLHLLCDSLCIAVIDEGIEQRAQVELLKSLNISSMLVQGYYFEYPLSKEAFEALIQKAERGIIVNHK